MFLEADPEHVKSAAQTGTDRIEFYTGKYASMYQSNPEEAIADHIKAAKTAITENLGINAGHDLNLDNLNYYVRHVPNLLEVSIGHALISDALYFGIQNVIGMYLHQIQKKN